MVSAVEHCEHISADPGILAGKPVVRGTRISVEFLRGLIAAGWTREEIFRNYQGITPGALSAALAHTGR